MKNSFPVSVTSLELDEQNTSSNDTSSILPGLWIEALSLSLFIVAIVIGHQFWLDWFSSIDRVICTLCVIIGLIVAFSRSDWAGELSKPRIGFAVFLWCRSFLKVFLWQPHEFFASTEIIGNGLSKVACPHSPKPGGSGHGSVKNKEARHCKIQNHRK